jgi:putative spermidine/putrescine transport system ATP-binding protein
VLHATREAGEAMAAADRIAVLVDGRLRQCAAPRDLYEAPADATVARLLGEDNRLPGLVEAVEDGIARIRLACGPLVEADAGDLAAGRRCIVSVRPERIAVAAVSAAEMGEGAIPAMLRDIVFRGDHVRLIVSIGGFGGDSVVVRRPATAPLAGLVPGADLALAWQSHHARALRPEAGA